jgi:ethanolamine ammonia-lyase small subunit
MDHNIPAPSHPEHLRHLLDSTPARLGVWRAGSRPLTATWLKFRQDHAQARDAVHSELTQDFLDNFAAKRSLPIVQSTAINRRDFVLNPPKGKQVSAADLEELKENCPSGCDVQIVISDGLSAQAVESNIADLLPMLEHGFALEGITYGRPIITRFGRVAVADQIGFALSAKLAINLIGERPGLSSAQALSAYLTFNPGPQTISSDRTVVSNIHSGGTPAAEAGAYIVQLSKRILETGVSGVRLQQLG